MSWNSIIGQERVKKILTSAIENDRLAHAYLFVGPEGTGKAAVAFELAKTLNCLKRKTEACDVCESCKKFASLQHPNLGLVTALPVGKGEKYGDAPLAKLSDDDIALIQEEIQKKAANAYYPMAIPRANGIKINSIRSIRRESSLSLIEKGRRVFVILDADLMMDEATNALLKTVEEPQPDTMLILTTSKPDKLLPTIISRCQRISFELLSDEEILRGLTGREHKDHAEALLITRVAQGSYGRALQLMDGKLHERRAEAVDLLRFALYKPKADLVAEIDRLNKTYERQELAELLSLLQMWLRDAMYMGIDDLYSGGMNDDETIRKFVVHHPEIDYGSVVGTIDRAISLLSKNVYIPLILITMALGVRKNVVSLVRHAGAAVNNS